MRRLNYHHLLYFWTVAREGSVVRASQRLHLSQPAVSGQLRALERDLGERLFERTGRRLVLTDVGRTVFHYAEEIFTLGRELGETLAGRPSGRPLRLVAGIVDVVPKLVAYRLLEPALGLETPVRIVTREDRADRLLAELARHELDVVISDGPVPSGAAVRAFGHVLGECGVTLAAAPRLATRLARGFPSRLDGAPFLMPAAGSPLRRALEAWFEKRGVSPRIAGEFEDSALAKAFAHAGAGALAIPSAIEKQVARQNGLKVVGRIPEIRERFYALTVQRRLEHPAVLAIIDAFREHPLR